MTTSAPFPEPAEDMLCATHLEAQVGFGGPVAKFVYIKVSSFGAVHITERTGHALPQESLRIVLQWDGHEPFVEVNEVIGGIVARCQSVRKLRVESDRLIDLGDVRVAVPLVNIVSNMP